MEPSTSTPSVIRSDALPKGAHVRLTPLRGIGATDMTGRTKPRHGTVACGKKGTIRCIKVDDRDGYYPDMGDTYIDEITHVLVPNPHHPAVPDEWLPFQLTEKHAAAMAKIRAMGF